MAYSESSETLNGSDCTGSSGDINRVLTLSNTGLTKQGGFLVYVSGLMVGLDSGYSVSHKTSGTEITFLSRLWDDMEIIVYYYEYSTTKEYDSARGDIQDIILEHGQTGTLIRQSKTTDSMGGETANEEEEYIIITMIQDISKKDRNIHEMGLAVPGNVKAFFYHEYPNSITGNGTVSVQVGDIYQETSGKQWRIEEIIGERYLDENEIFRVGILRNIGLDE
jgi:hypothetical protein